MHIGETHSHSQAKCLRKVTVTISGGQNIKKTFKSWYFKKKSLQKILLTQN